MKMSLSYFKWLACLNNSLTVYKSLIQATRDCLTKELMGTFNCLYNVILYALWHDRQATKKSWWLECKKYEITNSH